MPVGAAAGDARLEDLPSMLKALDEDCRSANDARRDQDHVVASSITDFRNTTGVQIRDQLIYAAPDLARSAPQLTGKLKVGNTSVVSWTYPASELPRAEAFLAHTPRLIQDCIEHWEDTLHKLVRHADQVPIIDPPPPRANEKWKDRDCRVCLCGARGTACGV